MSRPSALEQYMLWLVNHEREEAGVQPLAFGGNLNESAQDHSRWMIETDTFSHYGEGGSMPNQRMMDAGYVFSGSWTWGENIAYTSAGSQGAVATLHNNLMNSPSHRANILNDSFGEIGIGFEVGQLGAYNASMVTQNFARTGYDTFLTGVVYDDRNGDRGYDPGEGRQGRIVIKEDGVTIHRSASYASGGFDVELDPGTYRVRAVLDGVVEAETVIITNKNEALDFIF